MIKALVFLLQLTFILIFSEAKSSGLQPQAAKSFNVSYLQSSTSCSYTVVVTTSCSSTRYTRDQISIAFGDAYGNQIYAPRLDDPSTRAFERCSSDTFQIYGPCAYQICYVYLYRTGPDGWKPETVKIYGYNTRAVTFTYNTFIPSDLWYGFNLCQNASSSHQHSSWKWFVYVMLGLILSALM
ncbi:embryo-specific protein ATS3B-like [Alnus glutinosa]|uniref:embryo-specific protein ATS3B-like n=1 Tax=Alnus glutinosa TaxID=3517 RepID=UPI002D78839D|nr:embryo-specific protein ATS3B-like [Alnus glutinosa]